MWPCSSYSLAEQLGVDQIAVVGHRDGAHQILPQQRLGVAELAGAGGGIADVTDGRVAGEFFLEHPRVEDLADQAHAGVAVEVGAVGDDDAGRFLAAVLLGEEALVADLRRFRRAPDAEQAALFLLLVFVEQSKRLLAHR